MGDSTVFPDDPDIDVHPRQLGPYSGQHAVPVDLWQQHRGSSRPQQIPAVLSGRRRGSRSGPTAFRTHLPGPYHRGERCHRRRHGSLFLPVSQSQGSDPGLFHFYHNRASACLDLPRHLVPDAAVREYVRCSSGSRCMGARGRFPLWCCDCVDQQQTRTDPHRVRGLRRDTCTSLLPMMTGCGRRGSRLSSRQSLRITPFRSSRPRLPRAPRGTPSPCTSLCVLPRLRTMSIPVSKRGLSRGLLSIAGCWASTRSGNRRSTLSSPVSTMATSWATTCLTPVQYRAPTRRFCPGTPV